MFHMKKYGKSLTPRKSPIWEPESTSLPPIFYLIIYYVIPCLRYPYLRMSIILIDSFIFLIRSGTPGVWK